MALPPISPFDPDFMKKMQILAQIQRDVPGAPPSEVNFLFNKYMNEKPVTNPFEMSSTPPLLPSDIDYNNLSRRERKIYQKQGFDLSPELYAEGVDREKFPRYPSSAFEPDRSGYTTIFDATRYNERGIPANRGGYSNTMEGRQREFNELLEKERGKATYTGKIDPDFVRENYSPASGTFFDERIDPVTQMTLDSYGMSISDYWNLDENQRKKFNENIEYMGGKIPTGESFAEEGDIESEDQLSLKNVTNLFGNLNPYGTPMAEDLMRAGSQFASGRRGSKLGGTASLLTAGLEGARNFLTGWGAQKRWNQGLDWFDENIKRTQYTPVGQTQQGYLGDVANAEYGGLFTQNGIKEYRYGGTVPPGYHMMPDGTIMADSEHYGEYKDGGMPGPGDPPKNKIYSLGIQEYNYFLENPDMWKEDPDMVNPDGSLNLCLDCINIDWSNEEDVRGAAQLINEGYSTGTHYNADQFNQSLEKFGIPKPVYGSNAVSKQAYGGIFKDGGCYECGGVHKYPGGGMPPMNPNMMGAQQPPSLKDDPRFQPGEYIEFEYGGKMHKGVIKSNDGESIELE